MKVERVAAAAIGVGVLAVAVILVFGPRNAPATGPNAAPIAQPITPAEYPYSSLALLREQRTADDVLPTSVGSYAERYVPASVHRLVSTGDDDVWLAVQGDGELCLLLTTEGEAGANSICSTVTEGPIAAGTSMAAGGFGQHLNFAVVSDGTPAAGVIAKGYRQILPNVWFRGRGTVASKKQVAGDPYAFPRVEPYRSVELLRRNRTAADAAPKALTDDPSDSMSALRLDQLRYAGEYAGTKIWVTIDTKGDACVVVAGDGIGFSCASVDDPTPGESIGGIGVEKVSVQLFADGKVARDDVTGQTKIAPNVWAGSTSD